MKKAVFLLISLFLLGLMAATNPTMDDFQGYIRQSILKETQKNKGEYAALGQMFGSFVGGLAGNFLAGQAIRNDYIFFSTYGIQFANQRFRTLGILKNFFILEAAGN